MGLDRTFTVVLKRQPRPEDPLGVQNNLVMFIFNYLIFLL